ncbi:hypothetical protein MSG28_003622 [Choristoneura fumiferana]|uniref:Uncharacterized protein n=1 Tax=Choristoneura fumiferana TaxID=7141 RepID=A0ACC0KFU1_CHOFU|nr:hypothetical protein MSG28_003622 [Choristoneura fumiferana]
MEMKVPKIFKLVRYNLAAVNSVFVLTGVVLLIVGIVVLVKNTEYEDLITNRFFTLPGFAVATGVIILFVSVLGYYAAISEKFYFIAGYVALLLVILIFEMSITIAAFKLKDEATSAIRAPMVASIQLYESRRDIARLWDELHRDFECCGAVSVNDWRLTSIPVSCCHIDYGTISPFDCVMGSTYPEGCMAVLGAWLSNNANVLAVTALVFTIMQIILTAISGWLAWRSKFETVELES